MGRPTLKSPAPFAVPGNGAWQLGERVKLRPIAIFDYILGLSDPSLEHRVLRFVWGLAVPLVLVGYGISCIVARQASIFTRRGLTEVVGSTAVAVGIAYAAIGLLVYVHCCWEDHPLFAGVRGPARYLLVGVAAAALASTFALTLM